MSSKSGMILLSTNKLKIINKILGENYYEKNSC